MSSLFPIQDVDRIIFDHGETEILVAVRWQDVKKMCEELGVQKNQDGTAESNILIFLAFPGGDEGI